MEGVGIDRAPARHPRLLLRCDGDLDLRRDRLRHLALEREDVPHVALVGFGPEVTVRRGIHEEGRDPDAVPRAEHRAFDDRAHVEGAGDVPERRVRALVAHDRRPRDDAQRADLRQACDQRFRHAVREIVLLGIAGEVLEREHRDRIDAPSILGALALIAREGGGPRRAHAPEVRVQLARGGVAALGTLLQEAQDDPIGERRDLRVPPRRRDGVAMTDRVDERGGERLLEREPSGRHLVEHDAQRVEVAAGVDALAPHVLRRGVAHRAHELAAGRDLREVVRLAQQAEVHDVHIVLGAEDDVLRLDVAVDHAEVVRVGEAARDAERDRQRPADRELASVIEDLLEGLPAHEFHRDVEPTARAPALVDAR